MEDDAHGVPQARADATDAMPEVDAVGALRALDRPVVNSEGHRVALLQRHDFGPALHARSLFRQYKLTAGKIPTRLRKQNGNLERERKVTVKVLMQAIEVPRHVLQ